MDNDIRPVKRPPKSLQAALDARNQTPTPPPSQSFQTPDEVAADDDLQEPAPLVEQVNTDLPPAPDKPKAPWRDRLRLSWPPGKKEWIVLAAVVLLLGGGFAAWHFTHKPAPGHALKKVTVKVIPKPKTVPSTLTGLPVDPSVNDRPVTGVMIENSLDARPQSGLSQAGVVFEAVAEGGVTRFLALFQDSAPSSIGPVRSARPYYIQWALGFDAAYAHVGGSPDGLADIQAWGVKDLDEFANAGAYERISSRDAPHNVYTSISTLNNLEASKGYGKPSFTGFARKPKEQPVKTPTARIINFTLSGPLYDPHFEYDAKTNTYNRSEDGAPHLDANGSVQISPKVVIAIVVPESQGALDASGAYYSDYQPIGTGAAYVYEDGTSYTGTWTKASSQSQITFADGSGKPILLNAGQTWITAVTDSSKVSSSP